LGGVVLLLWLTLGFSPLLLGGDRGTFGDMFGAVNSLFSGLAFAGLIYAILLQQQELALQREELSLTRNELKVSAQAQIESAQALTRQLAVASLTAQLTAYSSLLQSANEAISSERYRLSQVDEPFRGFERNLILELQGNRAGHEASLKELLKKIEESSK
jgi:hypothetical protein